MLFVFQNNQGLARDKGEIFTFLKSTVIACHTSREQLLTIHDNAASSDPVYNKVTDATMSKEYLMTSLLFLCGRGLRDEFHLSPNAFNTLCILDSEDTNQKRRTHQEESKLPLFVDIFSNKRNKATEKKLLLHGSSLQK